MVTIKIETPPVPKGRPRFRSFGKFVSTYTDKKTKDYESLVSKESKTAMGSSDPIEGPVDVFIYFSMPIPTSYSKKRSEACLNGSEMHTKKPDIDNLIKGVLDGMNGVVYRDDTQIVNLHSTKRYSTIGMVEIMVREACLI
jgi:Holliday junction resolvase RusA-like endonuclease